MYVCLIVGSSNLVRLKQRSWNFRVYCVHRAVSYIKSKIDLRVLKGAMDIHN